MRYPGGGVSERFGCPLPLLAGCPDEVEEEGTEGGSVWFSGTVLARSSSEGISGGSKEGSWNYENSQLVAEIRCVQRPRVEWKFYALTRISQECSFDDRLLCICIRTPHKLHVNKY